MTLGARIAVPEGWYERAAVVYAENAPTEGYMDVLARRMLAGDQERTRELVLLLSGLAEFKSVRYRRFAAKRGLERDDLRQAAMCEMLAGLRTWDPAKTSFKLHALGMAQKGIIDLLRLGTTIRVPYDTFRAAMDERPPRRGRSVLRTATRSAVLRTLRHPLSLSEAPSDEGGEPDYLLGREDHDFDEVVVHLSVEQALRAARITPEQRTALEAVYGEGATQQERVRTLAAELGVNEDSVRYTARRALLALRVATGTDGPGESGGAAKVCRDCGASKPLSDFYRRSNSSTPQSTCKKCHVARSVRNKKRRREQKEAN